MRYVLLLRGINVGGKNKVVMAELRQQVAGLGYEAVQTYINSGNLFFDSDKVREEIIADFQDFFASHYPFVQTFSLLSASDYVTELAQLPDWWQEDLVRKDVLFFTEGMDRKGFLDYVGSLELGDECFSFTEHAVYWGKWTEKEYLKTAYHKQLGKSHFYKQITIRNDRTFAKLAEFLGKQ